jgi:acetyl-CoA acetyltransferase
MRNVAIVAYSQSTPFVASERLNDPEMLMPLLADAHSKSGIPREEIGFTCSGSTDYSAGQAFAFVHAVDALGAYPPIRESHVEMDGAWALYEAWVKIQTGEVDSALAFCFGRASMGTLEEVLTLQLDPYTVAPLGPDDISLAALQARAMLDTGKYSERDFAEVAVRSASSAKDNPDALRKGDFEADAILSEPCISSPLREGLCPPVTDGAAVMVIAAEETAREACGRSGASPVWIRSIEHRVESQGLGLRHLSVSVSAKAAGEAAGIHDGPIDFAELHAPYAHQELILRDALGLDDPAVVNRSGGALAANPFMVAGLARIGEASRQIRAGKGRRAVAHATAGPCLQQNLVCVLEGE